MVLSALSIAAITIIVCTEVLLRSVFSVSTLIATEFPGYLLVANVFLGLAWTFRNGGFIRVELVYMNFGPRLAAFADFTMAAVGTAVLIIYTYYLCWFVLQSHATHVTSIYVTRTPLWIPQLVMPAGLVLLTLSMLMAAVRAAVRLFSTGKEAREQQGNAMPEVDSWL
ncbi:TRAP transporter small permease subunit [Rhodoligotrophos defluvii]|uniref:TRAP transporter small permease subunit n=1 Tax=Rhodoligotrophos defluvii TaxID=2561934 RepID=UPI0014851F0E|nr:TRAP transporter small permease [Rhodoligotrophos defluvii]